MNRRRRASRLAALLTGSALLLFFALPVQHALTSGENHVPDHCPVCHLLQRWQDTITGPAVPTGAVAAVAGSAVAAAAPGPALTVYVRLPASRAPPAT